MFKRFLYSFFCFVFVIFSIYSLDDQNGNYDVNILRHKDAKLDLYLDCIKHNINEKIGLLPYIHEDPVGTFLEVGVGGDSVKDIMMNVPKLASPTIVAIDIDENIIQSLLKRHPSLNDYLDSTSGACLRLKNMNATKMRCFPNDYFKAINASAVVHEIISYSGGLDAFSRFIKEAFRTLKYGGTLIYRDPEAVANREQLVVLKLKTLEIRAFVNIYLAKFLDRKFSSKSLKYLFYDMDSVKMTFYRNNESSSCTMLYKDVLQLGINEIDFSRPQTLVVPRGLCREIERHYLTYLNTCNPLMFVSFLPVLSKDSYFVSCLSHLTEPIFNKFIVDNSLEKKDRDLVDFELKKRLEIEVNNIMKPVLFGIPILLKSRKKRMLIEDLLKKNGIDPFKHIVFSHDDVFLFDYRIFGLLYDYLCEYIFDAENCPVNDDDVIHAEWLRREGEETYTYYSDAQIIKEVACITLEQDKSKNPLDWLVLCPSEASKNKFIPRNCYNYLLDESIEVYDLDYNLIPVKDGKRIIHFEKMTLRKAIPIFKEIAKQDLTYYSDLNAFVENIERQFLGYIR